MKQTLIPWLTTAALLVLGAGSASAATPYPAAPACVQDGTTSISCKVYLHDANPGFHIAPEEIRALVGETVHLEVINQGQVAHDLIVCGDPRGTASTCQDKWGFTPMLSPGAHANITFSPKKSGTFDYYCDIPGHKAGGMVGALVVTGGSTTKGSPGPSLIALMIALGLVAWLRRR